MDGYLVALDGLPTEALKAVVIHLIKGTWFEEVKFCPRPPELANMVRHEQRRLDAMSRPRLPAPATVPQPFKDLRITQQLRAEGLERAGYVFIGECKGHDQFAAQAKKRLLPAGAIHLWAIDQIWAPRPVAVAQPIKEQADAA